MLTPALALCIAGAAIQAPPSLDAFRSRLDTPGSGDSEGRVSLYGRLPLPWPGTMFVRVMEDGSLTLVLADAESGLSFRFEKGVCQAWMREGAKRSLLGEAPFRLLPPAGLPSFPSTLPGSTPLPSGPRPLVWQDWPGLPPKPETH